MSTMHALPPRYDLWPVPVQHAMRLRGALISCGPGVRGAAWPDSPKVRLAALATHLDDGFVAARLTAAWVWQASAHPGTPLIFAAAAGRARKPTKPGSRRYECRFAAGDTVKLGEFGVTSPRRTLIDLLHQPLPFDSSVSKVCRNLLHMIPDTIDQFAFEVGHARRPYVRLARTRLRELLLVPEQSDLSQ